MITIFSTYVASQIKEIHHPELLQEWKLNFDAAEYRKNMMADMYKPFGGNTNCQIGRASCCLGDLFDNRKKCKENVHSVELFNIYNYKQLCLY